MKNTKSRIPAKSTHSTLAIDVGSQHLFSFQVLFVFLLDLPIFYQFDNCTDDKNVLEAIENKDVDYDIPQVLSSGGDSRIGLGREFVYKHHNVTKVFSDMYHLKYGLKKQHSSNLKYSCPPSLYDDLITIKNNLKSYNQCMYQNSYWRIKALEALEKEYILDRMYFADYESFKDIVKFKRMTKSVQNQYRKRANDSRRDKNYCCQQYHENKKIALLAKNWDGVENKGPKAEFLCGGALISNNHVLTAAHCAYSPDQPYSMMLPQEIRVRLGAYQLFDEDSNHLKISEIIIHPNYNLQLDQVMNDFAILTLTQTVLFSFKIQPICLPTGQMTHNEGSATVAGWGTGSENVKDISTFLKTTNVSILSDTECMNLNIYGSYDEYDGFTDGVGKTKLCTLDHGQAATCSGGDSGGALTMMENERTAIIGVTSYGMICGSQIPAIYAKITKEVTNWIKSVATGAQDSDCDRETSCEDCGLELPSNRIDESNVGEEISEMWEDYSDESNQDDENDNLKEDKSREQADDYRLDIESEREKSRPHRLSEEDNKLSTVLTETSTITTPALTKTEELSENVSDPQWAEAYLLKLLAELSQHKEELSENVSDPQWAEAYLLKLLAELSQHKE